MPSEQHTPWITRAVDWVASALGIGTFLGVVNIGVGLLSGAWLAYQLYVAIKYDLPVKKAQKRIAERQLRASATQPSDLA